LGESVIVDTYAILSMAFDQLGKSAEEYMLKIREGEIVGVVTPMIVYELIVHWLRGRIPSFQSVDEVKTFLYSYFTVNDKSGRLYRKFKNKI